MSTLVNVYVCVCVFVYTLLQQQQLQKQLLLLLLNFLQVLGWYKSESAVLVGTWI